MNLGSRRNVPPVIRQTSTSSAWRGSIGDGAGASRVGRSPCAACNPGLLLRNLVAHEEGGPGGPPSSSAAGSLRPGGRGRARVGGVARAVRRGGRRPVGG